MLEKLLSLLFPLHCAGCSKHGTALCDTCFQRIPLSEPLEKREFAVYSYTNQIVQKALWQLKYHHRSELAQALLERSLPYLSEYIAQTIPSLGGSDSLIFVPIPQSRARSRARGFSQSALIARAWQKLFPQAVIKNLLLKTRDTLPQARVSQKNAREQNIAHSMTSPMSLSAHALYIVVDDVITTGATVREAVRALSASGARNIISIALAHGYAPRKK